MLLHMRVGEMPVSLSETLEPMDIPHIDCVKLAGATPDLRLQLHAQCPLAGTYFSSPEGRRLSWPEWLVTHPFTNRARGTVTSLMWRTPLYRYRPFLLNLYSPKI